MKHVGSIKGTILFTDIKNFTLKSSLLTQIQIEKLLNKQDSIVFPIIKKYFGQIVKSLGDSYMVVFEKPENAISASVEIQEKLFEYNSKIKFSLYKIELRISIDYGDLDRKSSIKGEDYFGTPVNIASRIQSITPENKIFISGSLHNELSDNKKDYSRLLGKKTFKGILYEVEVYEIFYKKTDIELLKLGKINTKNINEDFITDDMTLKIKKIDNTIFKFASVAAILGIQPVPFLDIYGLLPLHIYLLNEISKEYGIKLNKDESKEIISTIMGSVIGSYVLSQGVVGISKIGLLGVGGYLMIPLNFALTYSMGKVLSYYMYKKQAGVKSTNGELKTLFKYSMSSGKDIAKKEKSEILSIGKKYKDVVLKKVKSTKIDFKSIKDKIKK